MAWIVRRGRRKLLMSADVRAVCVYVDEKRVSSDARLGFSDNYGSIKTLWLLWHMQEYWRVEAAEFFIPSFALEIFIKRIKRITSDSLASPGSSTEGFSLAVWSSNPLQLRKASSSRAKSLTSVCVSVWRFCVNMYEFLIRASRQNVNWKAS